MKTHNQNLGFFSIKTRKILCFFLMKTHKILCFFWKKLTIFNKLTKKPWNFKLTIKFWDFFRLKLEKFCVFFSMKTQKILCFFSMKTHKILCFFFCWVFCLKSSLNFWSEFVFWSVFAFQNLRVKMISDQNLISDQYFNFRIYVSKCSWFNSEFTW
jgi:hypothetical protein